MSRALRRKGTRRGDPNALGRCFEIRLILWSRGSERGQHRTGCLHAEERRVGLKLKFEAARRLGIRNVVWASSETVYGIPYPKGPQYVPVDEEIEALESGGRTG